MSYLLSPPQIKHLIIALALSSTCFITSISANQNFSPPYPGDTNPNLMGNKVSFSISESQQMDNDISTVTFSATAQASSAKAVTDEINHKMQTALSVLKKYPAIIAKTSQYQIHPAYNKKQVIRHWNGSQSLTVTINMDSEQLNILTELQEPLIYQSMQFRVSAEQKQKAIQQLTLKALQSFQLQAKLIAKEFNAPSYQILETRINTPYPRTNNQSYAITSRMVMAESMAPPVIEAGESTLKVEISGVLLLPPK